MNNFGIYMELGITFRKVYYIQASAIVFIKVVEIKIRKTTTKKNLKNEVWMFVASWKGNILCCMLQDWYLSWSGDFLLKIIMRFNGNQKEHKMFDNIFLHTIDFKLAVYS